MIAKRFTAAQAPHPQQLGDDIRSLMDNGAGGFHYAYDGQDVVIEHGDWTGIDLGAVQKAIDKHKPVSAEPLSATGVQPPLKKVHRFHIGATTFLVVYEVLRAFGVVH